MAFANSAVSDIIATTIQSRSGVIADNVTHNNALLLRLKKNGRVKPFSGSNVILQELSFSFYDKVRTGKLMSRVTTDLFDITELAHHGPGHLGGTHHLRVAVEGAEEQLLQRHPA